MLFLIFAIYLLIILLFFYLAVTYQLPYRNSTIHYSRVGSGPRPVLCFHGYGEEGSSFEFLGKYAGEQFTFYAIDLPFHGKTEWKEGLNFSLHDLQAITDEILEQNLKLQTVNYKLTLLGYSLGGRIALSLYQTFPHQVEKLVLLAPDGLKVNFWYWLATQTWLGNRFFSFTMKHPGWFFGFLQVLNKTGLVNASIFKFVNYYIGNKEVRRLLYERWTGLRNFKPDIPKIKSQVRENKTPVKLVYGQHDRIILASLGDKFKARIEDYCNISVIPAGHQVLHEKHIREILAALL